MQLKINSRTAASLLLFLLLRSRNRGVFLARKPQIHLRVEVLRPIGPQARAARALLRF